MATPARIRHRSASTLTALRALLRIPLEQQVRSSDARPLIKPIPYFPLVPTLRARVEARERRSTTPRVARARPSHDLVWLVSFIICRPVSPILSTDLVPAVQRPTALETLVAEEQEQLHRDDHDGDRHRRWERAVALKLADLSVSARRAYRHDLVRWEEFLGELETHPVEADVAHARAFARYLGEHLDLAPATVARTLSSLSGIYHDTQLTDPGLVPTNPFDHVRRPKIDRTASTPSLSLEEARTFLAAAKRVSPRAHALALLLLTTGIRISEALAADFGHLVRHADGVTALQVTRKGEIRGYVALPKVTLAALEANLRTRSSRITTLTRAAQAPRSAAWPLLQGRRGRLTASEARREIERICRAAGWPAERVTAHGLRHSFATAAVEHGELSPRRVQHVLGHASMSTTETYLHDHRLGDDVTHRVAQLLAD